MKVNARVNGQQRMRTPPWHLILSPIFVEIRVYSAPVLYFSLDVHCMGKIMPESKFTIRNFLISENNSLKKIQSVTKSTNNFSYILNLSIRETFLENYGYYERKKQCLIRISIQKKSEVENDAILKNQSVHWDDIFDIDWSSFSI